MRIISGTHKGKRIQAPKQLTARPTTDMAKEALFNILNNVMYLEDCKILDLFAGSGNISYEFASRGAPQITAVDKDSRSASFIAKTAKSLDFPIRVIKADAGSFLNKVDGKFDIIFADPPYHLDKQEFAKLPSVIFERELLEDEGVLIVEHSKFTDLSDIAHFENSRRYGSSVFSFFKK